MIFRLLEDRKLGEQTWRAGTTCYKCLRHDYGCAADDTRNFGEEHISVTLNADGGYPFFTAPVRILERIS